MCEMLFAGEEGLKHVLCLKRKSVLTAGPKPDAAFTASPAKTRSTAMVMCFATGRNDGLPAPPMTSSVIEGKSSLICMTIKKIMVFHFVCDNLFTGVLTRRSDGAKQARHLVLTCVVWTHCLTLHFQHLVTLWKKYL